MNISDTILSAGNDSAAAVLYKDTVVTYAELRQRVAAVADGLLARDHVKGDRVGLVSENSPFFVAVYLGIIRAGLVAVPLQTDLTEETFTKIVADAGIQEVFVSNRLANRFRPWAEKTGLRCTVEESAPVQGSKFNVQGSELETNGPMVNDHNPPIQQSTNPPCPSTLDTRHSTLACLLFTSGSTGTPKGVMVTHRNIEANTRDIVAYLGLTPADRVMVVLPLHYCFGTSLLQTHLMAGGSVVLNNDFRLYPEVMLNEMQQKECTGLAGVPSTFQILLRKSRFRQMSFPKLRWFQQAGGKLPNPCIEEIRSSFPHVKFYLMYGQTEATARLSYLPPEWLADKLGSVGRGLPSTRLEVLKPDGTAVTPGSAETGEIVAAGDNISPGYWDDPTETSRFFRKGKLYTGDIARVDSDGFIFIVEREREMIKSGGNRVSAKEVEDVIAEMPDVVEVAVVGAPHVLLGESIQAFVVLAPKTPTTVNDVTTHCRRRLPSFKTPQAVISLKGMPHNGSGKILKTELKRMLEITGLTQVDDLPGSAQTCEAG